MVRVEAGPAGDASVSMQPHRRESPIKSACRPARNPAVDKSNAGQGIRTSTLSHPGSETPINPRHAFWLELAALVGFALSALIWLGVAVATPAPMAVVDAAKLGARRVHDRLPAEIRERLPEEFRLKITGS